MKYWVVCNYHISALSRDSFKELKIRLLLNTKNDIEQRKLTCAFHKTI